MATMRSTTHGVPLKPTIPKAWHGAIMIMTGISTSSWGTPPAGTGCTAMREMGLRLHGALLTHRMRLRMQIGATLTMTETSISPQVAYTRTTGCTGMRAAAHSLWYGLLNTPLLMISSGAIT